LAAEAGRKGGAASHGGGSQHCQSSGGQGGNFAQDREKSREAGQKGGQNSTVAEADLWAGAARARPTFKPGDALRNLGMAGTNSVGFDTAAKPSFLLPVVPIY
jgi:general stress protein YciG